MTEIERIIKESILTEDFFKEEIRCEFLVDKKRKKLWAIELDMLMQIDRICKKHNINYFLGGGTLLGAVRHKGFIPWDDDIDINMFRDDYERFIKVAPMELEEPYFLQTPYTDDGYYFSFAKLRNSNTTAISGVFAYEKFNQGICLDVFPYDNMCIESLEEQFELINQLVMDNSTYMRKSNPFLSTDDLERVKNHSGRDPLSVYEQIQEIATKYNNTETDYVGNAVCTLFNWKKSYYEKDIFSEFIRVDFEGFKFPVPVGYEKYLEKHYGDWKKLPPVEKRGTWHSSSIIEPDIAYKQYFENYIKGRNTQ